jgi:hypothetical protein
MGLTNSKSGGGAKPVLSDAKAYDFLVPDMPVVEDDAGSVFYVDTGFNDVLDTTSSNRLGALCGEQVRSVITLLGTKYLKTHGRIDFNFRNDVLRLGGETPLGETEDGAPTDNARYRFPLKPMAPYGPILLATVFVNGESVTALVDTGSRWTYAYHDLSQRLEARCDAEGKKSKKITNRFACGVVAPEAIEIVVQGQQLTLRRTAATVSLSGQEGTETLVDMYASCSGDNKIMKEDADMTIGLDFLRDWHLSINFRGNTFALH